MSRSGQGAPGQSCSLEPCEPALRTVSGLAGTGCRGVAAPLWPCRACACPSPTLPAQDQPYSGQRGSEARQASVALASCQPGWGRWREQGGLSQGGAGGGAQGPQPGPWTLDPWSWEKRCLRALGGWRDGGAGGGFWKVLYSSFLSEKQEARPSGERVDKEAGGGGMRGEEKVGSPRPGELTRRWLCAAGQKCQSTISEFSQLLITTTPIY